MWLRWSFRDLRARWVQVAAIAFIIALGSGTYSGLTSTSDWRRKSYDASFRRLHMYDLRVTLAAGAFLDAEALNAVGRRLRADGVVQASTAQLTGPTQVDASHDGRTILVPGRIVGIDASRGGPSVATLHATKGRVFGPDDRGKDRAVVDQHFADRREISPGATIRVSGNHDLEVVGRGLSPEHFVVMSDNGGLFVDANYAITFVPIETAQRILGVPGQANVLLVRTRPGIHGAQDSLSRALHARFPGVGLTITTRQADRGLRLMYDDIEGDQRLYGIFASLILAGAAFAAFNLTARIVESQRREIGIGMALGIPPSTLSIRPLLMGAQIAVLGAVVGVGVGMLVGALMVGVMQTFFRLPVWITPFELGTYAKGAALGIAIPFVATLLPVWRAVRVMPVDAIRASAGVAREHRALVWFRRLGRPGRSIGALPVRNVVRQPRRTAMTGLGIAASIAVLVGVIGMLDSFRATIDAAGAEITSQSPHRFAASLTTFMPDSAAPVVAARQSPLVRASTTELRLPARVRSSGVRIDLLLNIGDLDSSLWHPTIQDRVAGPGIVLTEKAIHDLGLSVGDRVTLRFPQRTDLTSYRFRERKIRIIGRSSFPLRSLAWIDRADGEALTNLAGITNVVIVDPKPGVAAAHLQRSLFAVSGIASVQEVAGDVQSLRKEIDRTLGALIIVEGAVLILALLIAFNTASINADDRVREHATMLAFGLPLRTLARIEISESLLIGILGTGVGLAGGWALLDFLVTGLLPSSMPDLGIRTALETGTVVLAVVLGVVVVALAPLLTLHKLARMDIPSALRVME